MKFLSLPSQTSIGFMRWRRPAVITTAILSVLSIILFFAIGMNYGIDFRGGTVVEMRFEQPQDVGEIRRQIGGLNFGDVQIVEFGSTSDILVRVEEQPGGDGAQQRVVLMLRELYGEQADFRRVEVVGPRVSGELATAGIIGVVVSLIAILAYVWFRFEWQFAVGAVLTTLHDVLMTIGLYAVTQIEFNLTSIAAVLTIVGYSLNDTVVVYDRLRENLRRYKRMPMAELIDLSINQMLSRTLMTSLTTLLALVALAIFGGEVIRSFTFAMIWGILCRHLLVDLRRGAAADLAEPASDPRDRRGERCRHRRRAAGRRLMAGGLVIRDAHYPGRAPIDAYGNGGFRFAEMSHVGSILCVPSGIYGWEPTEPGEISPDTLRRVVTEHGDIDVLLLGVGMLPLPPTEATARLLRGAGVRFDTMTTGAAVRTYNVMVSEERRVAAALLAVG